MAGSAAEFLGLDGSPSPPASGRVTATDYLNTPAQPWEADPAGFLSGKVGAKVKITSSYRDPAHNAAVGGRPNSAHTRGEAYDFVPDGMSTSEAADKLAKSGLKFDQIINEGSHVHVSFDPRQRGQVLGVQAQKPSAADFLGADDGGGSPRPVVRPDPQHHAEGSLRRPVTPPSVHGETPPANRGRGGGFSPGGIVGAGVAATEAMAGAFPKELQQDYQARNEQARRALGSDLRRPVKPQGVSPSPYVLRAAKTAGDAMDYLLSPVSGAYDAVGAQVAGQKHKQLAGDVGQMLTPFGEAAMVSRAAKLEKAREAVRAGELSAEIGKSHPAPKPVPTSEAMKARPPGPLIGTEKDPVERLDNALYRTGGHATADKIEAQQFLKALPPEVRDPKVQERLYTAIEKRLADPKAKMPKDLQPAFKAMEPWYKEQTDIVNRLRKRGDVPDEDLYDYQQGYVARRVQGHAPVFDAKDPTERPRDPIIGGRRTLTKSTNALKGRRFIVLEDPETGKRQFVPPDRKDAAEWKPGMKVRGSFGKELNVKQATTAEIEANTDTRYHKNAVLNTVDNVLRLRRVERNMDVLDEATKGLQARGLAHRDEWHYRNDDGQMVLRRANTKTPDGFEQLPHIPQLKGWSFDPTVAEVLKDYHPAPDEPLDGVLSKVNRALTASLFITPVPHALNVGAHWAVGRGWDWVSPAGYQRLMKTGSRAMGEVLGMGPKYRQMLREGSGLLYGDTQTRNFYQVMMQKADAELVKDPRAFAQLKQAFGLKSMSPVEVSKAMYAASNKALWFANDVFMLQRQMELEAKGLAPRAAIAEAEKDIPNYRVPSRVLGSRELKQALTDGRWVMFGRYKYGQLKAWGSMFRDMYKGSAEERKEALGKFLVAAVISQGVYPLADTMLKTATGNKDARMRRSGPFSLTDAASRLDKGQIGFAQAMGSFITPSPIVNAATEIPSNRDSFSGRPIIEPESTPQGKVAQGAEAAAEHFYPAQLGLEAMRPGGAASAAGRLVSADIPPASREAGRVRAKKFARAEAKSRERKDPLTQRLKEMTQ